MKNGEISDETSTENDRRQSTRVEAAQRGKEMPAEKNRGHGGESSRREMNWREEKSRGTAGHLFLVCFNS